MKNKIGLGVLALTLAAGTALAGAGVEKSKSSCCEKQTCTCSKESAKHGKKAQKTNGCSCIICNCPVCVCSK